MKNRPLTSKEIDIIAKDLVNNENLDDILWDIEKEHYIEKPADIWNFLYHPNYLGALFNNNGKSKIYPFWMRLMADLYMSPFYTRYNELLISTAIGLGKSTITCGAIAAYEQHKLLCLKNPAEYYGLLSNSIIVTALFSSTMELVTGVNWPKLRDSMTISPWFRKRLNLSETEPRVKSLDLDRNVAIQLGSRTQHAISRDVLIAIVDEGNAGVLNDQVKENYNEIYKRRKSRFETGTRVPGILLACSSPKGEDDFINSRISREKDNPAVLVVDNVAEWQVKDKGYSGRKFWLFIGDDSQDGHCLVDGEDKEQFAEELLLQAPVEVRPEFEKDFVGALRDIAGRRSVPATALFKSRTKIAKCFDGPNIFTKDIITLDVHATLDDIKPFLSYKNIKMFLTRKYNRYIGIDFSLNGDKFGFAMGYAKYPDNVEYSDDRYIDKEYVIEGAVSFKAKTKEGVPSAAVRQLIRYFRNLGFPIQLITADKPGQVMLQDLLRDAFTVQYLSVDIDRRPYHVFKDQVSLGTITGPDNKLLKWEIKNIKDDGTKCLVGSTRIWTKEYGFITIEELANKGASNEFTIATRNSFGHLVQARAFNAHQTKKTNELVRVHLYNDETVECTPDHLIMLKSGMYKQAQDLQKDDELTSTTRCFVLVKEVEHFTVEQEPVYDITVPEHHNFLIEQGIFAHNCDHPQEVIGGWTEENAGETIQGSKDVSDSCCQIIYSAFTNPIQTNIMDLAGAINKQTEHSVTAQVKPLYYNTPKRRPSEYEAMKKAMELFSGKH